MKHTLGGYRAGISFHKYSSHIDYTDVIQLDQLDEIHTWALLGVFLVLKGSRM